MSKYHLLLTFFKKQFQLSLCLSSRINAEMPAGQSYVCLDLTKLPHILKQIFTSSLL